MKLCVLNTFANTVSQIQKFWVVYTCIIIRPQPKELLDLVAFVYPNPLYPNSSLTIKA